MKNILFLMCDQLNPKVLDHCMTLGLTPNLAQLRSRSANFTTAYCSTPLCTPSRASIVTGLYPHQHGIVSNIMRRDYPCVGGPETEEGIKNSDRTTEKILWQQGWRVGHVGKWHLLGEDLDYYPQMYREHYEYEEELSETFRQIENSRTREDYMDWYGWKLPVEPTPTFREAARKIGEPWRSEPNLHDFYTKIGPMSLAPEDTFDYRVASRAIDFLQEDDPRPFMLTCSFNAPHDPNVIPRFYYDKVKSIDFQPEADPVCEDYFKHDLSYEVAVQGGDEFIREFKRVYYASILYIDDQAGRVLHALESSGRADSTIIVFLADHGDMAGGHGMFWKGSKNFYDEIARVPFMICAPRLPSGDYAFPTELTDLMPTLLELCDVDIPGDLEGESLIPYCCGTKSSKNRTAFSERLTWNEAHTRVKRTYDSFAFMLRDSVYKYELYQQNGKMKQFLYNMQEDPVERRDLTASQPLTAKIMQQKLLERLTATNCDCNFRWGTLNK